MSVCLLKYMKKMNLKQRAKQLKKDIGIVFIALKNINYKIMLGELVLQYV